MTEWGPLRQYRAVDSSKLENYGVCGMCQRYTRRPWQRVARDWPALNEIVVQSVCLKCARPIRVMDGMDALVNGVDE